MFRSSLLFPRSLSSIASFEEEWRNSTTRPVEKVTVEQLENTLAAAHEKKDQEIAKRLGGWN